MSLCVCLSPRYIHLSLSIHIVVNIHLCIYTHLSFPMMWEYRMKKPAIVIKRHQITLYQLFPATLPRGGGRGGWPWFRRSKKSSEEKKEQGVQPRTKQAQHLPIRHAGRPADWFICLCLDICKHMSSMSFKQILTVKSPACRSQLASWQVDGSGLSWTAEGVPELGISQAMWVPFFTTKVCPCES